MFKYVVSTYLKLYLKSASRAAKREDVGHFKLPL